LLKLSRVFKESQLVISIVHYLQTTYFQAPTTDPTILSEILILIKHSDDLNLEDFTPWMIAQSQSQNLNFSNDLLNKADLPRNLERDLLRKAENISLTITELTNKEIRPFDSTFYKTMKTLHDTKKGSDFEIIIGKEKIFAHRFVLAGRLPYFNALLQPHTAESKQGNVEYNENTSPLSLEGWKNLLHFLYLGKLEDIRQLTSPVCLEILVVKEFLTMDRYDEFLKTLEKRLKETLDASNCIQTLFVAIKHGQKEVVDIALDIAFKKYLTLSKEEKNKIFENSDFQ